MGMKDSNYYSNKKDCNQTYEIRNRNRKHKIMQYTSEYGRFKNTYETIKEFKKNSNIIIEKHRHDGVFIARGKDNALLTRNMAPGKSVYAKKRVNIFPIIEDARRPERYRMIVPIVDVIFADVAQPDQARILGHNADFFLKSGGFYLISIKASCIESSMPAETVFAKEIRKLQELKLKPKEQLTLGPYEKNHAVVVGVFR